MNDSMHAYIQYVLPQKGLTLLAGTLADAKTPWLKNWIIGRFVRQYHIDMQDAVQKDPFAYPSFNAFFIRKLNDASRPIAPGNTITSPADGTIAQIGRINDRQLLQAKGFNFTLDALLANDEASAAHFSHGSFATIYLAPHNYHRVHMPTEGELEKMIYVPGKLFSVNTKTANHIPNLYSRNERLIMLFNTPKGKMAVIFVGAMIVAGIQPSWMSQPVRGNKVTEIELPTERHFKKGDELGYFNLGSTVIVLFEKDQVTWLPELTPGTTIKFGEQLVIARSAFCDEATQAST